MDTALFRLINDLPHFAWLDAVVLTIAHIQQTEACIALASVFLFGLVFKKHRVWISAIVLLLAFMFLSNLVDDLKPLFHRPRPAAALQNVHLLEKSASDTSFPSSQAALAALLFTYIYLTTRKNPALWTALLLLIGISRVYQGFHYPGDIAGGWVLGAAMACLVYWPYRVFVERPRSA